MRRRIKLLALAGSMLALGAAPAQADTAAPSPYSAAGAAVDGGIASGEWSVSPFNAGTTTPTVSFRNDERRLYVLVDVVNQTATSSSDAVKVLLDGDRDHTPSPGDFALRQRASTTGTDYLVATETPPPAAPHRSSGASGFGCWLADGSLTLLPFGCRQHRVYELGIDLRELGVLPGGHVRLGIEVVRPDSQPRLYLPSGYTGSFSSSFYDVTTTTAPNGPYRLTALRSVQDTGPIEITQATQDRVAPVDLVARKATVARVRVRATKVPLASTSSTSVQRTAVYLYGERDGVSLPGSPLVTALDARQSPDDSKLGDAANFVLPSSWTAAGTATLRALVTDDLHAPSYAAGTGQVFRTVSAPLFWTIPLNTGTSGAPVLPASSRITDYEQATAAIFPVPSITYVRKSDALIGPIGVDDDPATTHEDEQLTEMIARLNNLYDLASYLPGVFGSAPMEIFGARKSGGGAISDPTWSGGRGVVAAGNDGSSLELTMAHELNHDLDRRNNAFARWGKHSGAGSGCNTEDNTEWPGNATNNYRIGADADSAAFDPGRFLRLSNSEWDLMSYCRLDAALPSKWLEPYRWSNLLSVFRDPPTGPGYTDVSGYGFTADSASGTPGSDVARIDVTVPRTGTDGTIEPVWRGPGIPMRTVDEGDDNVKIEILDPSGASMTEYRAQLSFTNPETDAPLDAQRLSASIAVPPGPIGKVRVLRDGVLVAQRTASAHAPSVRIVSPNGGETITGPFTLTIDASDPDGDAITWSVLQSPDDGASWFPAVVRASGTQVTIDPRVGPGGSHSLLRVIATDGMNTVTDDTDATFSLPPTPPTASITSPPAGAHLAPGAVHFDANAVSATGRPLDGDALVAWFLDGQPLAAGRPAAAALTSGTHELRLRVTDDETGAVAEDSQTLYVDGTCADTGAGDPTSSETGLVSGLIAKVVDPLPTLVSTPVRGVNCGIVVPVGL